MELTRWVIGSTPPGTVADPDGLDGIETDWLPFEAPGTVAAALMAAGPWDERREPELDGRDWWFRTDFSVDDAEGDWILDAEGLATLADVWLNGCRVLTSRNMFRQHRVPLDGRVRNENSLVIRCASLTAALGERRPRPRWKTKLIEQQNLRWFRTTLHGRRPTWTGGAAPVGPWRPISVRRATATDLSELVLRSSVEAGSGVVEVRAGFVGRNAIESVDLVVGAHRCRLERAVADGEEFWSGRLEIDEPPRWWPATHGDQPLLPCRLEIAGESEVPIDLGQVGFRSVEFGPDEAPELTVNGVPIFARGVCWVPIDPIGLAPDPHEVRRALEQIRDAGFNLVRVNATAVYEDATFFDLCDELGLMVWQDLMFARMDYPVDDAEFVEDVRAEIEGTLGGLAHRPSLVVVCGGSEIGQQAAMLGQSVDPETLVGATLRDVVADIVPTTPYLIDAPIGGDRPFAVDTGVAFYFGVGGYRRPLEDARRAQPRFLAECLAFSNVPDDQSVNALRDAGMALHDSAWKQGVPRDPGSPWDFEDVRDHYVGLLYAVDPARVRAIDPDHYLDLGRAAASRAVEASLREWRLPTSTATGAVILEARDCRRGAGPGLVDVHGRPKPTWYAARRALAPLALLLSDEGLNGLRIWAVNDTATKVDAELRVRSFSGTTTSADSIVECELAARSSRCFDAETVLGTFHDVTYSYRFGPSPTSAVVCTLEVDGRTVARAVHRPWLVPLDRADVGLGGTIEQLGPDVFDMRITSERFAHFVMLDGRGVTFSDYGFDIEPGGSIEVRAVAEGRPRVWIRALNGLDPVPMVHDG